MADKIASPEEAVMEILTAAAARGDPPTLETATNLFVNLFSSQRYTFQGRPAQAELQVRHRRAARAGGPHQEDVLEVVRYLID